MMELFGVPRKKKNGEDGKVKELPPLEEIQSSPSTRPQWIQYSARDSALTWCLWVSLHRKLTDAGAEPWTGPFKPPEPREASLYQLYLRYWRPFAEVLVGMEREGMALDRGRLREMEGEAARQVRWAESHFRSWASSFCPAASLMNVGSDAQVRQLLYGGQRNKRWKAAAPTPPQQQGGAVAMAAAAADEAAAREEEEEEEVDAMVLPLSKEFKIPLPQGQEEEEEEEEEVEEVEEGVEDEQKVGEGGEGVEGNKESKKLKKKKKKKKKKTSVAKSVTICLTSLGVNVPVIDHTSSGWPAVSSAVLRKLAGKVTFPFPLAPEPSSSSAPSSRGPGSVPVSLGGEEHGGDWLFALGGLSGVLGLRGEQAAEALRRLGGFSGFRDAWEGQGGALKAYLRKGRRVDWRDTGCPWEEGEEEEEEEEEDTSKYGAAYGAFGEGRKGREACVAMAALCEANAINTLLTNFILPLQGQDFAGPTGRVHCSLNINTETGRLSARKPSLQNQPGMEKDRYGIRRVFRAEPGNRLIVADYGQLELRLLAHMSECKSMLDAFRAGGDFHSRTAMNMYSHVKEAIDNGEVLLEWDPHSNPLGLAAAAAGGGGGGGGPPRGPPVPLLKDKFRAERQKAKMLNFSIAYGKTAIGLSKDWNVSRREAENTLELWYSDRPEVKRWQDERRKEAEQLGKVFTLLGRPRHLPGMKSLDKYVVEHNKRAAINTPVQGSAADVAMLAMLRIHRHERLQTLGYKLLLQVHDEVILEGPEENVDAALAIVVDCMERPFEVLGDPSAGYNPLMVDLVVDAKHAGDWYSAK